MEGEKGGVKWMRPPLSRPILHPSLFCLFTPLWSGMEIEKERGIERRRESWRRGEKFDRRSHCICGRLLGSRGESLSWRINRRRWINRGWSWSISSDAMLHLYCNRVNIALVMINLPPYSIWSWIFSKKGEATRFRFATAETLVVSLFLLHCSYGDLSSWHWGIGKSGGIPHHFSSCGEW